MEDLMPLVNSLYGLEVGRRLYDDVVALRPHEGVAFFPFTPAIRAGALILEGSILVEDRAASTILVVPLRLMFPKTYPSAPPTVIVVPPQNTIVRRDHPKVGPDGTCLTVPKAVGLLELLLMVASDFAGVKNFPFEDQKREQRQTTPSPPRVVVVDPLQRAVEEKLMKRKEALEAEVATARAVTAGQKEHLNASRQGLEALREALIKKKEQLLQANVELTQWNDAIAAAIENKDILSQPSQWFVLSEEEELQVADKAHDDALDVLEALLKGGTIRCEGYLKEVSNVARQQFVIRALLNRLKTAHSSESGSVGTPAVAATPQAHFANMVDALQRQFPSLARGVIETRLRSAKGNVDICRQSLEEDKEWDFCSH